MTESLAPIGGSAVIAAIVIQWLKNSGWASWFTRETARANMALSILTAGIATVGINYSYNAATDTLAVVGVAAFFKVGIWQWAGQWITQHAAYKGLVVAPETLGEIRGYLARLADGGPISEGDAKAKGTGDGRTVIP